MTAGVELVNTSGNGDVVWTPTKAGTYYLTHETQTNGVNGAELLGAWFTVGGPKLTFTPDGELTPGVNVAIGGAGEGWQIFYTLDGSAPTQSSASEYSAPITLSESATIRAIAYSAGGVESEEFSATFTLYDALSVVGAVAKPRYPWNGKVDIDCELKGDAGRQYAVSLEARDLDGGTNLPVRTVTAATSAALPAQGTFILPPGTYRFTWDAEADIAGDGEFPNVAVSVTAEGGATIGAKRVVTLTVDGYAGTEVLTNVPTLVRLSTAIEGFDYADFADANGGDLIFCDEAESVIYPHEIDEWHVDGESLVWVRLPTMANGTKFKAAWGNPNYSLFTITSSLSPHEVWRDYAGVWHMNEDSGTAYDSTAHGLDALPSRGTNTLADIRWMVAYENGACGRARVCAMVDYLGGNRYEVPSYDALQLGSTFVASGWYRADQVENYPKMFYRNNLRWADGGWGAELRKGSSTNVTIVGSSNSKHIGAALAPNVVGNWVNYIFAYDGTTVSFYTNGVFAMSGEIIAAGENGVSLKIGQGLNGQCDEIRLRGGSLSADRIKADYDMVKNRNFLRYSAAERGKGAGE